MRVKKLSALLFIFALSVMTAVCAHAADFAEIDTTNTPLGTNGQYYMLPDGGEVFRDYSLQNAQIRMVGGNDGYTFRFAQNAFVPPGLKLAEDGTLSGTPTIAGFFTSLVVNITNSEGEERTFTFALRVASKPVYLHIKAPNNAVYDGHTYYTAEAYYTDIYTGEILDTAPVLRYGIRSSVAEMNAGNHRIEYATPAALRIVLNSNNQYVDGDRYLYISPASSEHLSIEISAADRVFEYDGNPHGLTSADISVKSDLETKAISYGVRYRNRSGALISGTPTLPGSYTAEVYTTDTNYDAISTTANITILAEEVYFTIGEEDFTYNGEGQAPEITPSRSEAEYTVTYRDAENNIVTDLKDGKPYNAGEYTLEIRVNDTSRYSVGSVSRTSFTINKRPVVFATDKETYLIADGQVHQPIIATDPLGFTAFEVKYKRQPDGELVDYISELGVYDVIITILDDNYVSGTGTTRIVFSVDDTAQIIDFDIGGLTHTYDGTPKSAAVTPSDLEAQYTVKYSQNGEDIENPTEAGEYYVTIIPEVGYGVGTKTPENPILKIEKSSVTFTASDTSVKFDGQEHKATISSNNPIITEADYKVQYRDKNGKTTDSVQKAGEYDIVITLTNSNFKAEAFAEKFTIETSISMNKGNSPAAMIFNDSSKTDEEKQQILESFIANRAFTAENVPSTCKADIRYPLINGIDVDGDVNTVIVKKLSDYQDPGIVINGETKKGSDPVLSSTDGLYTVTYTYETETFTRYIMVLDGKIGDTDGSGVVNALDANALDKMNTTPKNVIEARIWDVNKDGILNKDDATAIRGRFAVKLVPYYSWL